MIKWGLRIAFWGVIIHYTMPGTLLTAVLGIGEGFYNIFVGSLHLLVDHTVGQWNVVDWIKKLF